MKAILKCFPAIITTALLIHCSLQATIATAQETDNPAATEAVEATAAAATESSNNSHHDIPPEVTVLDSMVNLYGPVEFDHEMHMGMTDCATCHHHMSGEGYNPYCQRCHKEWYPGAEDKRKCKDCHVADRFVAEYLQEVEYGEMNHRDHRGLMSAFHNQCLPCHQENDIAGCQVCHERTEKGDEQFHADAAGRPKKSSGSGH